MLKKYLLLLTIPTLLFVGCSKSIDTSTDIFEDESKKTETYVSVPKKTNTPLSLNDKNISSTKFLPFGSLIFFPDKENNNYLSVINDNLDSTFIDPSTIIDSFNYSIESIATNDNNIFFSNIADNNSLYKLDYIKKTISKISDSSFYNISASTKYLFFINKNEGLKLSSYDLEKNVISSITSDKCGKYVINGDFILYENLSDNSSLYSIKIDGSERTKLTQEPIDSFVPYNNSVIYISGIDNNLYKYDTILKQTNRIHILNGTDLKNYDDKFYYIDMSNSNHIYSLEFNEDMTKAWSTELTSDMVNEYYPTSKGIFYKKPIDINKSYFLSY